MAPNRQNKRNTRNGTKSDCSPGGNGHFTEIKQTTNQKQTHSILELSFSTKLNGYHL